MFSSRRRKLVARPSPTIEYNDFEEKWRKQPRAQQEEKLKDVQFEVQKLQTLLVSLVYRSIIQQSNLSPYSPYVQAKSVAPDIAVQTHWESQLEKLLLKQDFLLTALGRTPAARQALFNDRYTKASTSEKQEKLKGIQFEIRKLNMLLVSRDRGCRS